MNEWTRNKELLVTKVFSHIPLMRNWKPSDAEVLLMFEVGGFNLYLSYSVRAACLWIRVVSFPKSILILLCTLERDPCWVVLSLAVNHRSSLWALVSQQASEDGFLQAE